MTWGVLRFPSFAKYLTVSASLAALLAAGGVGVVLAQDTLGRMQESLEGDPDARMLLEAEELVYDFDNEVVEAVGDVEIYYNSYTVEADRVTYDQRTGRVFARGNVRVTSPDGSVIYSDTIELTEDFREGFVEQLTVVTPEAARFMAVSAERQNDNVTIFNRGIYTACEPCRENPDRPPVWQIKASRIIHNQQEQVVYYENASFELLGVPIAYAPYMSHPDPTVRRKSGFLPPAVFHDSDLGFGGTARYFMALAPNYDLTASLGNFSKQGVMAGAHWRHRLASGQYEIRGYGIRQNSPEEFAGTTGDRDFRGFVEGFGEFRINDFWRWGFEGAVHTDPTFTRKYGFTGDTEYRNQLYLTGQSANNWFDARTVEYRTLSASDNQNSLPFVHPIVDYNYLFDRPILGGRLAVDANVLSLSRSDADFSGPQCRLRTSSDISLRNALAADARRAARNEPPRVDLDDCTLAGMPGNTNRIIAQARWDKTTIGRMGQVLTPFAAVRGDGYAVEVRDPYAQIYGQPVIGHYLPVGNHSYVRGMATAGVEYRWPILISSDWGQQIVEPVAQIIARPDEPHAGRIPNEDAQSLVFDDTILFAHDKFSGYDRIEGGTRANLGLRYNMYLNSGRYVSAVFGQSIQLAGENPFPVGTGLESHRSDYVAAAYVSPFQNVELASKLRLDKDSFEVNRHDLQARARLGRVRATSIYSEIGEVPELGYDFTRREIQGRLSLDVTENWNVFGMGRYEIKGSPTTGSQWISHGIGIGYVDECISLALAYERRYVRDGDIQPDERILFRFSLRTVMEGEVDTSISDSGLL